MEVLEILPDRIGHGTCLQADGGGTEDLVKFVRQHKIPLGNNCNVINIACQRSGMPKLGL